MTGSDQRADPRHHWWRRTWSGPPRCSAVAPALSPRRWAIHDRHREEPPSHANTRGVIHERAAPRSHLCDRRAGPPAAVQSDGGAPSREASWCGRDHAPVRRRPSARDRAVSVCRGGDGAGIPGGHLEPGEAPLACARRELLEETGYRAEYWRALGTIYSSPGFCDERQHLFLARLARCGWRGSR